MSEIKSVTSPPYNHTILPEEIWLNMIEYAEPSVRRNLQIAYKFLYYIPRALVSYTVKKNISRIPDNWSSIRKINLIYSPQLKSIRLKPLSTLTNLNSLDFSGSKKFTGVALRYLTHLTNLTEIILKSCVNFNWKNFSHINAMKNLQVLNLTDFRFAEEIKLTTLTELNLSFNDNLTDALLIKHIKALTNLTKLDVSSTRITSDCFSKLDLFNLCELKLLHYF